MRLKVRAREARRPAIWALAALLALVMAPAAAAKEPSAGTGGAALGSDRLSGPSAALLAIGTGFHRSGASERVREVQRRLNRLGYGAGAVDGLFGPITDAAVRRFQSDSRLAVDGVVGRRTLGQLLSRSRQQERLLARGSGFSGSDGSERVRDVQQRLNRLGYGAGAVDGLFGPITDAAVRRYQSDKRLAVDGVVGPRTLRSLGSSTEPVGRRNESPRRSAERRQAQRRSAQRRQAERRPARAESPARPKPPAPVQSERAPEAPSPPESSTVPEPSGGLGSAPEETVGPRWGVLVLIVAMLGLVLVLALAFRADRSPDLAADGWDDGSGQDDDVGGAVPPEIEPELVALRERIDAERPDEPLSAWRAQLVDVPHAGRLLGVGAHADLSSEPWLGTDTGTVYVELQLFAEGQRRRWETDPLDGGAPFSVAVEELEESVRAIVPDRLPALARVLRNGGIDVQPADLQMLPFMLELSPQLEGELVRRRLGRRFGTASRRGRAVSSSEGGPS